MVRRDADNRERMAVDQHRLADDLARRPEPGSPVVVAEHRDGIGILRRVVLLRK